MQFNDFHGVDNDSNGCHYKKRKLGRHEHEKIDHILGGEKLEVGEIGGFEKHTKGIGLKLLQKMGYNGGGLGKNEQGIVMPLETKIRRKNMGMGFNETKETAKTKLSVVENLEQKRSLGQQQKMTKVRKKEENVTLAEWLAKKQEQGFELDVRKIDNDSRNEEEIALSLTKEKDKLEKMVDKQKLQVDNIKEIFNALGEIERENISGTLTLDLLADYFGDLRRRFSHDYELCNLSCIAYSLALPLFRRIFEDWDLQNPSCKTEVMSLWKDVFRREECLYARLISEVVLPAVRIYGISSWDVRDPEPMLKFLESWEELLPYSVLETILDTIIMPKLSIGIDSWDSSQEDVLIHVWVHPWLPMLGHKLEYLCDMVGVKLSNVLDAWHPSDISALNLVLPWKTVFDSASWDQLMCQHVVPKLKVVLQEFQIDPKNQKLDQFNWLMSWATVLPMHIMVYLMERFFFAKWLQVLRNWLNTCSDFEEIHKWYVNWKQRLPQEILANRNIRSQLSRGLDMISQAVDGVEVVPPELRQRQRQRQGQVKVDRERAMTLKEVLEAYAEQHGLVLKPKPGRMHNGHQIYGFGKVSLYIDSMNEMIYARKEEGWTAVTLDALLRMSLWCEQ